MLARDTTSPQPRALADAGVVVAAALHTDPAPLARHLVDQAADDRQVVWVGSADADPGLTDALAAEVARRGDAPEIEVLVGAWDLPGSRLLDAVAVMDRLRSPGGCPWDAQQTHRSLVPYLIEEAHEAVEAVESGDREHLVEELGDVLLQVLFHARVADEDEEAGFDIDDVAAGLVAKLVRRHPHVFGAVDAPDAAAVEANWEQIKATEKPEREHPLDGIPAGMPELARAAKVASRLERAGHGDRLRELVADRTRTDGADPEASTDPGAALMAVVLQARAQGVDPSAALRALLRDLAEQDFGGLQDYRVTR
ncbi:MazG family protein [Ornithinicoccus hortensis]|uniref:XTP/dITP diphosphohydrolase n=1 Tax=Ornithinicoccus hortensis TaxID=82346 RepID=A0A542YVI3_9MICO|nr:MazG family protein [Ornithinicoccus hortensis]TQL52083.1 XTP/dITP diphosphohydrolase [Ornithinicoccus hortensis]